MKSLSAFRAFPSIFHTAAHDVEIHIPSKLGDRRMGRIPTGDGIRGLLHLVTISLKAGVETPPFVTINLSIPYKKHGVSWFLQRHLG